MKRCRRRKRSRFGATYPKSRWALSERLISTDGAFVSLRHGVWAEAKMLVIGEVEAGRDGEPHTHHLSYCARLGQAEHFSQLALVETHRRGVKRAQAVCAVTDGAEWLVIGW